MRPVIHSSDISMATAVTKCSQEAVLGNKVATRVRRLSSLLTRSRALLVRSRRRCDLPPDFRFSLKLVESV